LKFLANENFPLIAVQALREQGHDVLWVLTEYPGISDQEVLLRAHSDNRILLTFDKDFGELAFRTDLPASCGIILFRTSPRSPSFVASLAVAALSSRSDWQGYFSVIEESRIRMTPLPR
jgi:predicted nuclease of predicted toxin-antitoxin system